MSPPHFSIVQIQILFAVCTTLDGLRNMTTHDHNATRSPRENLDAWLSAFNTKNIESLCSLYDPQSLYANAAAPLAHGIEQIKPWYSNAFAMVNGTLLFKEEALFQESTMALLVGKYYFKAPAGNDESCGDTGRCRTGVQTIRRRTLVIAVRYGPHTAGRNRPRLQLRKEFLDE
ncbi:MAG: ketosteroid isomerase-like protein [Gammaproteobacteria bacterium]